MPHAEVSTLGFPLVWAGLAIFVAIATQVCLHRLVTIRAAQT